MASNTRFRTRGVKFFGPGGVEVAQVDFTTSGSTADVTVNENQGATVARTGVGTFVVTLAKTYKTYNVTIGVQASTTAQQFLITARTATTFTITQVTAASGTAVDTLAARINVQIIGRTVS
jgi:hypothetical protein